MACPHCGEGRILKDYAPPRAYALILFGLGVLFVVQMLRRDLFRYADAELYRTMGIGVLTFLFGLYDAFRHRNRYCAACGFRFRLAPSGAAGQMPEGTLSFRREPQTADASPRPAPFGVDTAGAQEQAAKSAGRSYQPLEPILACLKFKDPKMRSEAAATLRRLTGEDFGEDHDAWSRWWAENKDAYKARMKAEKTP